MITMQGNFFRPLRPLILAAVLVKTGRLAMPPKTNQIFNLNRRTVLRHNLRNFIVLIVGSLAIFFSVVFLSPPPLLSRPFDPNIWRKDHSVRAAMYQDFLRNNQVIGMALQNLVELLGPSNRSSLELASWDMEDRSSNVCSLDFHIKDGKVDAFDLKNR